MLERSPCSTADLPADFPFTESFSCFVASHILGHGHSLLDASRAPSTSAPSFAQAISACTRPPRPQSVPAMTLSRPTAAGEAQDALGHQLGMLDQIGRVADDARQHDLAFRQLDVLPQLPFVLVAHVGGLERIALRLDLQHQVDDVLERQIVGVRPVPGAPAQVIAHAVLRNALRAHG